MTQLVVHEPNQFPITWFANFGIMFLLLFIAIIRGIGMMLYYIMHAVQNKNFSENDRIIWILILFLPSGLGSFIYFFVIILPFKHQEKIPLF